jgi:hypothetical protein
MLRLYGRLREDDGTLSVAPDTPMIKFRNGNIGGLRDWFSTFSSRTLGSANGCLASAANLF